MPLSLRLLILPLVLALAGCAPIGTTPGNRHGAVGEFQGATPETDAVVQTGSPRLVLPATGGPPMMAIQLGGNLYLPLTGEAPFPGLPIGQ